MRLVTSLLLLLLAAAPAASQTEMPTAAQIAAQMAPGWNLGNTLEASHGVHLDANTGIETETAWQPTLTTPQLIHYVRQLGFRSVRIPCNWVNGHITDSLHTTIDPQWLARVREIVDCCISDSLYVVLNDHWDGGWLENQGFAPGVDVPALARKLQRLWTQIALYFRDYDHHLLFAGLNEPFHDESTDSVKVARLLIYEQAFIDAVRATGGNNRQRTLVVQGPQTDINATCQHFHTLPVDPVPQRLMLEVHYYDPWNFCGLDRDADWGKAAYYYNKVNYPSAGDRCPTWGDNGHAARQMQKLQAQFVSRGTPVIIGEYGALWRQLPTEREQQLHDASIRAFFADVTRSAIACGCVPFVWDINVPRPSGTRGTMTVLDRSVLQVYCQPALDGIFGNWQ